MDPRARVVEGLLELIKAPDGSIKINVVSAIGELGYPEFCEPLFQLIQETQDEYLVGAYCLCASRKEKQVLIEFLESDNEFRIVCAVYAAERLVYTDLIPVLENLTPPKMAARDVAQVLDFLRDKTKTP
jgi:hypothetical protein